jgi:hypothetical protein
MGKTGDVVGNNLWRAESRPYIAASASVDHLDLSGVLIHVKAVELPQKIVPDRCTNIAIAAKRSL